jgi:hypothetical protein
VTDIENITTVDLLVQAGNTAEKNSVHSTCFFKIFVKKNLHFALIKGLYKEVGFIQQHVFNFIGKMM